MSKQDPKQKRIHVRYEETSATYASQFLVNATDEDVIINFSSGYLAESGPQETVLPVHTRIAISRTGAKRLHTLLGQLLAQGDGEQAAPEAGLPKVEMPKE